MNGKLFGRSIAVAILAFASATSSGAADQYPTKPIRIFVPVPPGGALDITTRLVAQKMSEKLGQPIIVENRPGGDTVLGTRLVKDAPADGYTILAQSNGFCTQPSLKVDAGYDPVRDFTAIGPMLRGPVVIEVGAEQPDRSLKEFIARAHASPLSFASPGIGSAPHIAGEMTLMKAGVSLLHVPYKGASAAYPDVIGGRVPLMVDGYAGSASYLKSGRMRALAITGPTRITPLPDVPTLVEQGIDLTYTYWLGLLVRAGTPKEVVQSLSDALKYATHTKELNDRFLADGTDPTFMTSSEFGDYIAKDVAQVSKLVAELNIPKE